MLFLPPPPPTKLGCGVSFIRLNLCDVFSPSLHLAPVLLLNLIVFTWLDFLFSLDMVMSVHSSWWCLHSTRLCPSLSFIQLAHAPSTWLRHILSTLLIASFHLPLTFSRPSANFALSTYLHRIPNKQAERRNQHASQHIRLRRSFCESSCLRSGFWPSKMRTLTGLRRRYAVFFGLLLLDNELTLVPPNQRKNIEILKIRFGEAALQVCEVMLKYMTDSKRIGGHVESQKAV
jgi:hypothetical protein